MAAGKFIPMSRASKSFQAAVADVNHLMEFHEEVGGTGAGKREYRLQSLNKSAIVLLCASWESYVEDVIVECADAAILEADHPSKLPKATQQLLAALIEREKHELAALSLAGDGWREKAREAILIEVRALNTPKPKQVDGLFATTLGIEDVSSSWSWHRNRSGEPVERLNEFVTLRGAVAHGGVTGSVNKINVTQARDLVERIIGCTEERLKVDGFKPLM